MGPLNILKIIHDEIRNTNNIDLFKRFDFNRSLITPEELTFEDGTNKLKKIKLWLVFDENITSNSGYQIVYDENSSSFGLAVKDNYKSTFIGYYGTFVEAFRAM